MEKKDTKKSTLIVEKKQEKRLTRSTKDKIIAGVCGGLGEYFDIDPIILRIIFAVIALTAGSGFIIYIVLWVVMPEDTDKEGDHKKVIEKNAKQIEDKFEDVVESIDTPKSKQTLKVLFGLGVMFFGLYLLLLNFGMEKYLNFFWYLGKLWPVFVIGLGLYILLKQNDEK